jgi:hypothetical protein
MKQSPAALSETRIKDQGCPFGRLAMTARQQTDKNGLLVPRRNSVTASAGRVEATRHRRPPHRWLARCSSASALYNDGRTRRSIMLLLPAGLFLSSAR